MNNDSIAFTTIKAHTYTKVRFSSHEAPSDWKMELLWVRGSFISTCGPLVRNYHRKTRRGWPPAQKKGSARELENRSRGANNGRVDFLVCTSSYSCRLSGCAIEFVSSHLAACERWNEAPSQMQIHAARINIYENGPAPNLRALFCLMRRHTSMFIGLNNKLLPPRRKMLNVYAACAMLSPAPRAVIK